jgi:hypothetical protein
MGSKASTVLEKKVVWAVWTSFGQSEAYLAALE